MKRERGNRNETRDDLDRFIQEHPGVAFSRISKVFGLNRGTLRYHLDYLEGEDRLRMVRKGNQNCYFSNNIRAGPTGRGDETIGPKQRRLLMAIKENPGITRKGLIELTKQSRDEVNYGLRRLKDRKVIWKTADGGDPSYEFISRDQLAAEMMMIILEKFLDDEIDRETFLLLRRKLEEDIES